MRRNVDNELLPGIETENEIGVREHEEAIYQDGEYIGNILYTTRKVQWGTKFGWRPTKAAKQSALTTKVDAIRRLPKFKGES